MAAGGDGAGPGHALRGGAGHHDPEFLFPRQLHHEPGEAAVVLDDEEDRLARGQTGPVVAHPLVIGRGGLGGGRFLAALGLLGPGRAGRDRDRDRGQGCVPGKEGREIEGEGAPLARHAGDLEGAAEERGQLAADREAQAGAAVFAGRAGVGPAGRPRR